jgi:hypothetical protein
LNAIGVSFFAAIGFRLVIAIGFSFFTEIGFSFFTAIGQQFNNTLRPIQYVTDRVQAKVPNIETIFRTLLTTSLSKAPGDRSFTALKCTNFSTLIRNTAPTFLFCVLF